MTDDQDNEADKRRDEVLLRLLKTPPKPHAQVRQIVMTAPPSSMEIKFPVPERASPSAGEPVSEPPARCPLYIMTCADYGWLSSTRPPERSPGCSLDRTYPARDRGWRGGTSGSPSRPPGPRCPRPQVGDPRRSAPVLASAGARSTRPASWPQPA